MDTLTNVSFPNSVSPLLLQVGCYADNVEERVMSDQYINDYMTSTVCRDYCDGKDALYYATKVGIKKKKYNGKHSNNTC